MDSLDEERVRAEQAAKNAVFEDSAPAKPARFNGLSEAEYKTANFLLKEARDKDAKRARRKRAVATGTKAIFFCILVVGTALVFSDFKGWIQLGIFDHTPSPIAAQVVVSGPIQPQFASSEQRVKKPLSASALARIATLENGFNLMQKEYDETESVVVQCRWQITIRPGYYPLRPWSAAERIDDCQKWERQHPNPPLADARQNHDYYERARADFDNANTRLADCVSKESSLHERMTKCASEHDALMTDDQ